MKKIRNSNQTGKGNTGGDAEVQVQDNEIIGSNLCKTDESNAEITKLPSEPNVPKRILVIDDEPPVRKLLTRILEHEGYEVTSAADGIEGLQRFRDMPADLIITDIVMPEMNGHDFMIELKKDVPNVKIIAISGNEFFGPEVDLFIAETLGAVRIFGKPFNADEILEAVRELLK